METTMKCVKYLLFVFNLLFAISGFVLLISGGVIQGVYSEYLDFLGDQFFSVPMLLIIIGCLIFVITFFGCCGAIKENYCLVFTFAALIVITFIMEIGAAIAAYALKTEVGGIISINMEKGLQNYNVQGHTGVTETWNIVQHELECCGADEYKDWVNTTFAATDKSVPDSCCLSDVEGCGKGVLHMAPSQIPKIIYTTGCLHKLEGLVVKNVVIIGSIGIVIAFIQLVGVIFACCLARSIKKEYEEV